MLRYENTILDLADSFLRIRGQCFQKKTTKQRSKVRNVRRRCHSLSGGDNRNIGEKPNPKEHTDSGAFERQTKLEKPFCPVVNHNDRASREEGMCGPKQNLRREALFVAPAYSRRTKAS